MCNNDTVVKPLPGKTEIPFGQQNGRINGTLFQEGCEITICPTETNSTKIGHHGPDFFGPLYYGINYIHSTLRREKTEIPFESQQNAGAKDSKDSYSAPIFSEDDVRANE
eukprot:5076295-Ditylum_brightwellii.AAC.1